MEALIDDAVRVEPVSVENVVREKPGTFSVEAVKVDATSALANKVDPCRVE